MAEETKKREELAGETRAENQRKLMVSFAQMQQMSPTVIDVLKNSESPVRAIWILLCAIDGMPDDELRGMTNFSITDIQERRKEYLTERYASISALEQTVREMHGQVKRELNESRAVRSSLEEGIERAWEIQRQTQEQLLKSKDEMIELLRHQIVEQENRLAEGKNQKGIMKLQQEIDEKKIDRSPKQTAVNAAASSSTFPDVLNFSTPSNPDVQIEHAKKNPHISPKRLFAYLKRNDDAKKFIEQYLENEEMSEEQKEYLLSCMEEGMTLKEIGRFASAKLTVKQMERLRKIQNGED